MQEKEMDAVVPFDASPKDAVVANVTSLDSSASTFAAKVVTVTTLPAIAVPQRARVPSHASGISGPSGYLEPHEKPIALRNVADTFVSKSVQAAMDRVGDQEQSIPAVIGRHQGVVLGFTRGRGFNLFMAAVIAINAVIMGIETDYHESDSNTSKGAWFYVELVFTLVFCIEFLLKFFAERSLYFRDRWNDFDFLLVIITCLDTFILEHMAKESGRTIDFVNILRILRLLRMARIVRLLRFFKTLWLLIVGVLDAMRTLVWAWVLITIITFVFAIFMTRTLGQRYGDADPDIHEQFGRVEYSMFTLFQVMTLEGWPTIARNSMEYEPWIWVVFIVFLLVTTFSIMNVIVAVIVEGTLEQAHDRQAEHMKRQQGQLEKGREAVTQIFCATDVNSDGVITKEEFVASVQRQDVLHFLSEVGIDMRQAENLFDILDYDDSGSLDADEFSRGVLKARGEAQAQDVLAVQCELWRYELKIKEDLQKICMRVNSEMLSVDEEVEQLRLDISRLNGICDESASEAPQASNNGEVFQ